MFVTLDIISDLTYGKTFDLIAKHELRWLATTIVKNTRLSDLKIAFPWLLEDDSARWRRPFRWIFQTLGDEANRVSELLAKYSNESAVSLEKHDERSDLVSTLIAAHDAKTGDKLASFEVWDEANLMILAGEVNDTNATTSS